MVRARWPRDYHETVRRWIRRQKQREQCPEGYGNKYLEDDPGSGIDDEEPEQSIPSSAGELAMNHHTAVPIDTSHEPDLDCMVHGVFYFTLHGPGSWYAHHCFPGRPVLLELTDAEGRDLSHEIPDVVVPDDDEDVEDVLLIRTNGHLRYPLTLKIVPA